MSYINLCPISVGYISLFLTLIYVLCQLYPMSVISYVSYILCQLACYQLFILRVYVFQTYACVLFESLGLTTTLDTTLDNKH